MVPCGSRKQAGRTPLTLLQVQRLTVELPRTHYVSEKTIPVIANGTLRGRLGGVILLGYLVLPFHQTERELGDR